MYQQAAILYQISNLEAPSIFFGAVCSPKTINCAMQSLTDTCDLRCTLRRRPAFSSFKRLSPHQRQARLHLHLDISAAILQMSHFN